MKNEVLKEVLKEDPLYKRMIMPRVFLQDLSNPRGFYKKYSKNTSLNCSNINKLIEIYDKLINNNTSKRDSSSNNDAEEKRELKYKVSNLGGMLYTTRPINEVKKEEKKEKPVKIKLIKPKEIKGELVPYSFI